MTLVEYLLWEFHKEQKEKDMKTLLQKLLLQVVQEFAEKTFTFENLKLVRDRFLALLSEQVKGTETGIDDWAFSIVERMFADDNLQKMYDWIKKYADAMLGTAVCKTSPENTLGALAHEFDFTYGESKEICATPSMLRVVQILEIVIPILYDWFKNKK